MFYHKLTFFNESNMHYNYIQKVIISDKEILGVSDYNDAVKSFEKGKWVLINSSVFRK